MPDLKIDAVDRRILAAVQSNGRMSNLEIAEKIGLSPTPCARRLKRLEDEGAIKSYAAHINPHALGLHISAMISVRLSRQTPGAAAQFLAGIKELPEITEWMCVTGDVDYLIRIWVKDVEALRSFIAESLQRMPSVAETATMVILDAQHVK